MSEKGTSFRTTIIIVIIFFLTALITGGSVYYWQSQKVKIEKDELRVAKSKAELEKKNLQRRVNLLEKEIREKTLPPSTEIWRRFVSVYPLKPQHDFSVEYPSRWTETISHSVSVPALPEVKEFYSIYDVVFSKSVPSLGEGPSNAIEVRVYDNESRTDVVTWLRKLAARSNEFKDINIPETPNMTVGGVPAPQVNVPKSSRTGFAKTDTFFVKDNVVYRISYRQVDESASVDLYKHFLDSFVFLTR